MEPVTQISIADVLSRRYDDLIEQWGEWRNAQRTHAQIELVDEIFIKHADVLEATLKLFGSDVLPF